MRTPTELTTAFRAQGLKITPQRQLLFRLLHDNESHPSAEALFAVASERMPGISLRTVYQTLTDLVAMGELRQLSVGSGPARFDPNVDDHHHVVCSACGVVRDVYVSGVDVHDADGFVVESTDIVFRGVCASCAAPANTQPSTIIPTSSTRSS